MAQRKALAIFVAHGPLRPEEFARLYFGREHEGWKRVSKCGPKGSRRGGGLVLWAGGYIGKLRKSGFVDRAHHPLTHRFVGWVITRTGRAALRDSMDEH